MEWIFIIIALAVLSSKKKYTYFPKKKKRRKLSHYKSNYNNSNNDIKNKNSNNNYLNQEYNDCGYTNQGFSNIDKKMIKTLYSHEEQTESPKMLSYSEQYEAWINKPKEPEKLPYKKRDLLTPTEFEFYRYLRAICEHFLMRVCPKVRMEDFIEVTTIKERLKYRGYIKSRHVDYLITDRDFKIICAIELDDPSHGTKEAQKTDELKNEIYHTIGIPLYRVKTSEDYRVCVKEIMKYCIGIMKEWHGKKNDTVDATVEN